MIFAIKQPENEEELEQCYEALENCPVETIGDDGEKLKNTRRYVLYNCKKIKKDGQ